MTRAHRLIDGRVAVRLPGLAAARGRDVLAGNAPPATPRDAATVMLLRPPPAAGGSSLPGLEVFLLRRAASMAFAAGAHVFPGGSVDGSDADETVPWAGPDAVTWGRMLGAPPSLARAVVCAAVRETFEESGVLLAGWPSGEPLAGTAGDDWEADRAAMLAGSVTLAGLLRRRGLVLRSDLLRPWSRWITPVTEDRRFDARFFVAALPEGQHAHNSDKLSAGGEADHAVWLAPGAALAAAAGGEMRLLPPTALSLADLRACRDVAAALGAEREITALMPEVVLAADGEWLALPAGLEYPL